MSHGDGTKSAERLDWRVLASDAVLCCGTGNDCGESGNWETRAETTVSGKLDAGACIGGNGLRRGGCIGCVTAGHVDLDVFGAGSACMCA
jgi:hypothetical protein